MLLAFIAFSAVLAALSFYIRSREVAFVRARKTEDSRAAAYVLDRLRLGNLREVSGFVVSVLILTLGLNLVADAAAASFAPGFLRDLSTVPGSPCWAAWRRHPGTSTAGSWSRSGTASATSACRPS